MMAPALPFEPTGRKTHPEPVPGASQLAALPFTTAVAGYLRNFGIDDRTRIVLHRTVSREGGEYLQQLSAYAGQIYDPSSAGRMNAVTSGIIGKAYAQQKIIRTRRYADHDKLLQDLRDDMADVGDGRDIEQVARSYLAIPMISPIGAVAAILYADTFTVNAFASDERLNCIISMCREFCTLLDAITKQPLPGIRNYELSPGRPVEDLATMYPRLQEVLEDPPPMFLHLRSFNFEAGV